MLRKYERALKKTINAYNKFHNYPDAVEHDTLVGSVLLKSLNLDSDTKRHLEFYDYVSYISNGDNDFYKSIFVPVVVAIITTLATAIASSYLLEPILKLIQTLTQE
ncbi:MAG: hypothetical protein LBN00_03740 [Oscillospiraceae bacterium]|jgi:hypothetical protein|nr:hypothetical protein [Oscillospiraceae bacterium]